MGNSSRPVSEPVANNDQTGAAVPAAAEIKENSAFSAADNAFDEPASRQVSFTLRGSALRVSHLGMTDDYSAASFWALSIFAFTTTLIASSTRSLA